MYTGGNNWKSLYYGLCLGYTYTESVPANQECLDIKFVARSDTQCDVDSVFTDLILGYHYVYVQFHVCSSMFIAF